MKINHEIRFKCTKEEHDKIQKRANEIGMTIKEYILTLILYSKIKIKKINGE